MSGAALKLFRRSGSGSAESDHAAIIRWTTTLSPPPSSKTAESGMSKSPEGARYPRPHSPLLSAERSNDFGRRALADAD
jgi:hypothetical protein